MPVLIGIGILLLLLGIFLIIKDAFVNIIQAIRGKEKVRISSIEVMIGLLVVAYLVYTIVRMVINDNN